MKNNKHFLGINWKIRFINPQFIFAISKSFIISLITYTGLTETDLSSWPAFWSVLLGVMSNPVMLLNMADAMYNAVIDFTTKGMQDDNLVKSKTEPTKTNLPVDIEGKEVVNDESEIVVDNTANNEPPKSKAEEF
ncbi:phage holin [Macrococcus equi]|uniref:phage holin n=1 Tax=Macrococcus equi TaxID=3395462 RepID=UPI0039BE095F